jgi:hypothetical protein
MNPRTSRRWGGYEEGIAQREKIDLPWPKERRVPDIGGAMANPEPHIHDVPVSRGGDLIRLILVVLGAILLFIGWYNWLT